MMKNWASWLESLGLLLIVALAAYLRLANLENNPAWFADEGVHLEIARHLADGRIQFK